MFAEGNNFFVYPFKVLYKEIEEESAFPVQVLISVSKRKFKSAVKRNKVKRLFREAYRKNKSIVFERNNNNNKTLLIGFIYVADTIMDYHEIEKKIMIILQRLKSNNEKADR